MRVLGIDYSVNCPACCLIDTKTEAPQWFVNYRKIDGNPYPDLGKEVEWTRSTITDELTRFIELRDWVTSIALCAIPDIIVIEAYSFNAKGNITMLAENTGILKAALREHFPATPVHVVAPTTMKKFATLKGNATKDLIWAAFIKVFPQYAGWQSLCHPKAVNVGSPCGDIADSYFLAEYGKRNY